MINTESELKTALNVYRSSLDVELTCQAFKLPGVYDRKFETNYLQVHSGVDSPHHFHRIFHPYSGFPPNRKYLPSYAQSPSKSLHASISHACKKPLTLDEDTLGHRSFNKDDAPLTTTDNHPDLRVIEMDSLGNSQKGPASLKDTAENENIGSFSAVRNLIFGKARQSNITRLEREDINFSSIVDIDDEAFESYVTDDLAGRLGESNYFRMAILLVIILNSLMVGVQTDANMRNLYGAVFSILDDIFISIFIMEIIFKWYYALSTFWKSLWNWLDVILVLVALLGPLFTFGQSSRILKMFRMIRAFRSLRSIQALSGMYTVLQVVGRSLPDMANIMLLLLILMFIFAVVGVTLFGLVYPEQFGDLGTALFFLFILVTQDGWVVLFDELEKRGQFAAGAVYCALFIMIGGFIISNLIVAVVVTNLEVTYRKIQLQIKSKFRKFRSRTKSSTGNSARSIVNVNEPNERVYFDQIPYELPEFDRLTEANLEKYYLILMIIENNLREYVHIKEALNKILHELKEINKQRPGHKETDTRLNNDEDEVEHMDAGDALTLLINLQKKP